MKKPVMLVAALMAVAFVGLNYESTAYANDRAIPSIGVSGGVGSISVVWTTPAEAPYDYRLAWGLNGGYISYKASNTSTAGNAYPGWSATSYTISGLDPGTYRVKLRARYDGSAGSWKAASSVVVTGDAPPVVVVVPDPTAEPTAEPTADPTAEPEPPTSEQQQDAPPAAPTGLTASQVAHDSVTLTWSDPENTSITGYRILRGTETGKLSVVAQDTGSADTEYTDSTVAAETTYYYAVLPLSQDGDGAQSATASATTPAAPVSDKDEPKKGDPPLRLTRAAPGVPLNLAVVPGDTQLTFTWDPPTSDGDSDIIRYNYEFGPSGGTQADENHGTNPTGSQTLTKTGLTNGTAYTFKVRAVNMSGGSTTVGTYTAVVTGIPTTTTPSEVWTATLTPGDLGFSILGCSNGTDSKCSNTSFLSDDDFNYDSTDYSITVLFVRGTGQLEFGFGTNITTATNDLTLVVGTTSFAFADGGTSASKRIWNSSGITLTLGTAVTVKLMAPVVTDTTAPSFESAAADGTSLVITFDEDLAAAASLANTAFMVKKTPSGGSATTTPLSATVPVISGKTVTLTLATALVSTDTAVKVTYTKPTTGGNNKLVDAAGNETATFTDQTVTNNTPAAQTVTTFISNTGQTDVSGGLDVSSDFSYAQQFTTGGNPGGYTLSAVVVDIRTGSSTATQTSALHQSTTVSGVEVPGTKVVDLSGSITTAGEQSFTPASTTTLSVSTKYFVVLSINGSTRIIHRTSSDDEDSGGSPGWEIANNSLRASNPVSTWTSVSDKLEIAVKGTAVPDTTAPAFESAAANGTSLVITFDENLVAAASLANSAFTVKKTPSGGSEATVTLSTTVAPVMSGRTVTLTLATALVSTDTAVKVSYTKPTTAGNNKLVDVAANATATFTDQPVTNNTPALPVITIAAGASGIASTSPLEGDNAWFTLSRTGSTTAALTVNVTVSETGGDRVAAANEGAMTVTFTANSATVPLTVATVDDSVDQANSTVTMTVTASRATYTVGTPASATVTVQDDDTRGVTVSAATLTVNEGSTGTYTVKLDSQPTASVTVTPSKTGSSDVTFAPASLTFSTSNWRAPQTVTVTAAQDTDAVDDSATISHAVAGGDYGSVTAASVVVTVDDDESADTTAPAFESAAANGTSLVITFDEDLAAAASLANGAFTVKKTPSGGSEATVTLSTTTGPVISGKTVTLTLATALVSTDTAVKVSYTKPATGSNNKLVDAAANATATFTDQPVTNNTPAATPEITIAAGTSPVTEGTAAAFTLTRTGSRTAALRVNVTVAEIAHDVNLPGDMIAATNEGPRFVTFLANSARVTLSVPTVDDADPEINSRVEATIVANASSYQIGRPGRAQVTVRDNDVRGVTISTSRLTVDEGATGTYTVRLNTRPTGNVTVTPSKTGSSDVTFSPTSLSFRRNNWNTPQTVTVTAAQDSDAVDDSATIAHTVAGADYGTHSVSAGSVTVTVGDDEAGGNNLPTSRSGRVTATEDTAFTLSASNFAFFDGDSGATLASVKITDLPAAGKGTLALDGTAITSSVLPKTVTKADLDASKLKYTPPADGYGIPYTSFKFKVNDGRADSAAAYTMIINVTNVNDVPTGRPTISGSILVGSTLTASTNDIIDPDGLPNSFTYQWKRFAANGTTFEANIGTNSRTYRLTDSDQGKRVKAEVSFTDNGGNREGPLLSAATATVQRPSSGSLSVGGLGAYWYGNHDNGGNLLKVDSCSGLKRFRVIWAGPEGNRRADEWDAEITDRGGARTLSPSFRETPGSPGNFEMTGFVDFTGPGIVTFRVQGRFGPTWGTWSPKASLHCFEI